LIDFSGNIIILIEFMNDNGLSVSVISLTHHVVCILRLLSVKVYSIINSPFSAWGPIFEEKCYRYSAYQTRTQEVQGTKTYGKVRVFYSFFVAEIAQFSILLVWFVLNVFMLCCLFVAF